MKEKLVICLKRPEFDPLHSAGIMKLQALVLFPWAETDSQANNKRHTRCGTMEDMRKERRISFIILQLTETSGRRHTYECTFKATARRSDRSSLTLRACVLKRTHNKSEGQICGISLLSCSQKPAKVLQSTSRKGFFSFLFGRIRCTVVRRKYR